LILLLANIHIRKNPKTDQQSKVFLSSVIQPLTFVSINITFYFHKIYFSVFIILLQLDDNALNDVMKKLFKNYKKWCKYLGRKSSLW
jgi:callose synthase